MIRICDGVNWEIAESNTGYAVFAEDIGDAIGDEAVVDALRAHDMDALHELFPEPLSTNPFDAIKDRRVYGSEDNPNLLAKFTNKPSFGDAVVNLALGEGLRKIQSPTLSTPDYYGYAEAATTGGVLIMRRVAGNLLSRTAFTRAQYSMIDTACRDAVDAVGVPSWDVAWDLNPLNFISDDPRLLGVRELFDDTPITIIDQPAARPMQPNLIG